MHKVIDASRGRTLVVRLTPGTELKRSIEDVALAAGIRSAVVISCIGSLDGARLGVPKKDAPRAPGRGFETINEIVFKQPLSLVSAEGNIVEKDGKPNAHLHIAVAAEDGVTYAGHYFDGGNIFNTTEVVLLEVDDGAGLATWRHH